MRSIPRRVSLIAQTTEILREELRSGKWRDHLPSERFLSDQLKISRPTLRLALAAMRREGLIKVVPGKGSRVNPAMVKQTKKADSSVVVALSTKPLHELPASEIYELGEMRRHLQETGYQLEFHSDARLKWAQPQRFLENLVRQTKACCWLLETQKDVVQKWFAKRGLPTIILGSTFPQTPLPSIDLDFHAVSRHAVGMLFGLGHRRIALFIPHTGLAGDLASEAGFREAFRVGKHPDAVPSIVHHNQSAEQIRNTLSSLMRSSHAPTAILVSHAEDALSVVMHLMNSGMRVPKQVSVISRVDAPFLNCSIPSMARYAVDWADFTRRASRMIVQRIETGSLTVRAVRLMSRFKEGKTLGPPP